MNLLFNLLQYVIAMEELDKTLLEALNRYYDALSKLGYINYETVSKLIVALFLNDILNGEFEEPLCEKDYNTITKALYCILGNTCLIPFPVYRRYTSSSKSSAFIPRLTEDCVLRYTETIEPRALE